MIMMVLWAITGMKMNAQDWPQFRGPDREGIFKGEGVNLEWSSKKPALLWTFREAGEGYTAPTIIGTTLYCQGASEGSDFAFALDTQTGKLKWKQNLGQAYVDAQGRGNGSRGSVTVDGDKLYLVRGGGFINCLSAADGSVLWQKDFKADFGGILMSQWGFSESPLVDGNVVLCMPGGDGGVMVALDKSTGNVVWRSTEWIDQASYSSPIVAEIDGIRQYILLARSGVAGVAAKDGKLLWKADVGGNRTAVIPTVIYHDHIVYVTSSSNGGCAGLRIVKEGEGFRVDTLYINRYMENHHGGVVLMNGYIYGFSNTSGWMCQDLKTGEIVWSERSREAGKGSLLAVNDRLLLLDERTGQLTVIAASPDGWKEFGSLPIPERTKTITTLDNMVWTHPVIANGKLYVRDHDLLFCFDVKK